MCTSYHANYSKQTFVIDLSIMVVLTLNHKNGYMETIRDGLFIRLAANSFKNCILMIPEHISYKEKYAWNEALFFDMHYL